MSDTLHFGLFLVGICLLTGAMVVGVGAFEYEVESLGTVEELPDNTRSVVSYGDLSASDQRTVERVIAGERVVVRDPSGLPGPRKRKGKLAVNRGGETYLVTRRIFFNWRSEFGMGAIAMALAGLAVVSEAVRRHHFPHRTAVWTHR
ncbi:hypothetical protein M0R88_12225 [Halorussus gelatinilyticus]|uniref:DUF7979 domain-containing protein n=1 Tax=Halorussus gelatinilyticus TaxID=2937524 RepID=A0A8U0IGU6_9EURY|nr:hypothetical protein [Halorussus gelatinilyticus]UPV99288.1 hypothetical protein M0R88_12225 [Halorussus gelatinilyticus]